MLVTTAKSQENYAKDSVINGYRASSSESTRIPNSNVVSVVGGIDYMTPGDQRAHEGALDNGSTGALIHVTKDDAFDPVFARMILGIKKNDDVATQRTKIKASHWYDGSIKWSEFVKLYKEYKETDSFKKQRKNFFRLFANADTMGKNIKNAIKSLDSTVDGDKDSKAIRQAKHSAVYLEMLMYVYSYTKETGGNSQNALKEYVKNANYLADTHYFVYIGIQSVVAYDGQYRKLGTKEERYRDMRVKDTSTGKKIDATYIWYNMPDNLEFLKGGGSKPSSFDWSKLKKKMSNYEDVPKNIKTFEVLCNLLCNELKSKNNIDPCDDVSYFFFGWARVFNTRLAGSGNIYDLGNKGQAALTKIYMTKQDSSGKVEEIGGMGYGFIEAGNCAKTRHIDSVVNQATMFTFTKDKETKTSYSLDEMSSGSGAEVDLTLNFQQNAKKSKATKHPRMEYIYAEPDSGHKKGDAYTDEEHYKEASNKYFNDLDKVFKQGSYKDAANKNAKEVYPTATMELTITLKDSSSKKMKITNKDFIDIVTYSSTEGNKDSAAAVKELKKNRKIEKLSKTKYKLT